MLRTLRTFLSDILTSTTTPPEGRLRAFMSLSLFGAGVALTLFSAAIVLIVWLGAWSPSTEAQRLDILGNALMAVLGGVILSLIGLAVGGPIGRISGKVGLAEFNASQDKDDA